MLTLGLLRAAVGEGRLSGHPGGRPARSRPTSVRRTGSRSIRTRRSATPVPRIASGPRASSRDSPTRRSGRWSRTAKFTDPQRHRVPDRDAPRAQGQGADRVAERHQPGGQPRAERDRAADVPERGGARPAWRSRPTATRSRGRDSTTPPSTHTPVGGEQTVTTTSAQAPRELLGAPTSSPRRSAPSTPTSRRWQQPVIVYFRRGPDGDVDAGRPRAKSLTPVPQRRRTAAIRAPIVCWRSHSRRRRHRRLVFGRLPGEMRGLRGLLDGRGARHRRRAAVSAERRPLPVQVPAGIRRSLTAPVALLPLARGQGRSGSWCRWRCTVALVALSLAILPERRRSGLDPRSLIVVVAMGKFYGHELVLGQVNLLFAVDRHRRDPGAAEQRERSRRRCCSSRAVVVKPYAVMLSALARGRAGLSARSPARSRGAGGIARGPGPFCTVSTAAVELHQAWWTTVTGIDRAEPDERRQRLGRRDVCQVARGRAGRLCQFAGGRGSAAVAAAVVRHRQPPGHRLSGRARRGACC